MPTRDSRAAYLGDGGNIVIVTVPDPAAGANWTIAVPPDRRWRLRALRYLLVTSVAVSNRRPALTFGDGAVNILTMRSDTVQQAGISRVTPWAVVGGAFTQGRTNFSDATLAIPDGLFFAEGFTIASQVSNLQAADQLSDIRLWVEEWIDTFGP